ncbi:MAG: 2,3-epoxybenzoyl-CoA dihydrolase [Candidatus Dormibacteria bacterium]
MDTESPVLRRSEALALEAAEKVASIDDGAPVVSFATDPSRYLHWQLSIDGAIATLAMDVDEQRGMRPGYAMKLNSYDLGVDIELHDAVQRLRFEHPEVGCVVITSAKDRCFSAGANIGMLAQATHPWKVNFCKFTNETRLEIEDASANSDQTYLAAVNGAAAGGGYELALACDEILLIDDGSSAVSLPELPLLAVLPATGGLTRLGEKRHVRRDLADVFVTRSEGVKAPTAVKWGLVDAAVPRGQFDESVRTRALAVAASRSRAKPARGISLEPLDAAWDGTSGDYRHVSAQLDRAGGVVTITVRGPEQPAPVDTATARDQGSRYWPLAVARELDDLILRLRINELTLGTWVLKTAGDMDRVLAHDRFLLEHRAEDWFVSEVVLFLKRVFKRLDVTSRSLLAAIEPGSCFGGLLLELALACDQQFMLDGTIDEGDAPAVMVMTNSNLGAYPMGNALSRLESRFFGRTHELDAARMAANAPLDAAAASELGLVTFAPDAIDWDDEVRIALEQRAAFSPDALTGMEANMRFVGPETMETKIFGRLTAWQNWVFSRPNAIGPAGALRRYGSGQRASLDRERV